MPTITDRALKNQSITIFGDGEQTRDFIFVKDVAAANLFFAIESPATGVFNVAYGRSLNINRLASAICHLVGSRSEIVHVGERPGDVRHSLASIDKLLAAGFNPSTHNFEAGLSATIEFFRGSKR